MMCTINQGYRILLVISVSSISRYCMTRLSIIREYCWNFSISLRNVCIYLSRSPSITVWQVSGWTDHTCQLVLVVKSGSTIHCWAVDVEPLMDQSRVCCSELRERKRALDQKPGAAHSVCPIKSLSCYRLTVYTPLTEQHSKKSRCSHLPLRSLGDSADFRAGPCAEIHTAVKIR